MLLVFQYTVCLSAEALGVHMDHSARDESRRRGKRRDPAVGESGGLMDHAKKRTSREGSTTIISTAPRGPGPQGALSGAPSQLEGGASRRGARAMGAELVLSPEQGSQRGIGFGYGRDTTLV